MRACRRRLRAVWAAFTRGRSGGAVAAWLSASRSATRALCVLAARVRCFSARFATVLSEAAPAGSAVETGSLVGWVATLGFGSVGFGSDSENSGGDMGTVVVTAGLVLDDCSPPTPILPAV